MSRPRRFPSSIPAPLRIRCQRLCTYLYALSIVLGHLGKAYIYLDRGESDKSEAGFSGFVVAGCDAAPVLQFAEQALDEVAPAVFFAVMRDGHAAVAIGGESLTGSRVKLCPIGLGEVQASELAAEVEQRIAPWLIPGVVDVADEDQMVAAVVDRVGCTIERGQRVSQDR